MQVVVSRILPYITSEFSYHDAQAVASAVIL
jgi:hypothetical protein